MTGRRGGVPWRPSKGREHAVQRERGYGYTPQSQISTPLATDWPVKFGELAKAVAEYGPVSTWPVHREPCEIVLTSGYKRQNTLIVRCRCMAGTVHRPSRRFYGYDPIGESGTIEGALRIWRAHRDAVKGEDHEDNQAA